MHPLGFALDVVFVFVEASFVHFVVVLVQLSCVRRFQVYIFEVAILDPVFCASHQEPLKSEEVNSDVLLEQDLALYRIGQASETIDAADFVAIDWGTKARDWLLTAYPQLRDAKLRTNSLNLALNNLQSEGGIAVLPTNVESQLPGSVKVTRIETLENVSFKVYVHSMKQVRRVGLAEIIESVSKAC